MQGQVYGSYGVEFPPDFPWAPSEMSNWQFYKIYQKIYEIMIWQKKNENHACNVLWSLEMTIKIAAQSEYLIATLVKPPH